MSNKLYQIIIITFSILLSSCSLINSANIAIKYSQMRATIEERSYKSIERFQNVSGSVKNVQHPSLYDVWSSNFTLQPSIHYDSTRLELADRSTLPIEDRNRSFPNIRINRLSLFANLALTNHTPLGALAFTIGYGPALSKVDDGAGLNTTTVDGISKFDISWTIFLGKRFHIIFGPRWYDDGNSQVVYTFRFGYYFADIVK